MGMTSVHATSRVLTTERSSPCAPDMDAWLRFAGHAEESGIESLLLSFSRYEPDTLMIACAWDGRPASSSSSSPTARD